MKLQNNTYIILYRPNATQYERGRIYKNISGTIILFSKNFYCTICKIQCMMIYISWHVCRKKNMCKTIIGVFL